MTVIDILVKATAVLALAAIADARLRRRGSAAARHCVWASAMAALLALPIAEAALPHWTVAIPIAPPASVAPAPIAPATHTIVPAVSVSVPRAAITRTVAIVAVYV